MTTTMTNGVDTSALFGALDAVKAQPEAAKFQFRARNQLGQRHAQQKHHPRLLWPRGGADPRGGTHLRG